MKHLFFFLKFFRHCLFSKTKYNIHSPFVYDLLVHSIEDKTAFYSFSKIESFRAKMLFSRKLITVTDFGSKKVQFHHKGSEATVYKRKISSIAKNSLKSPELGQVLFRIVNRFTPKNMLEFGTSLGITTMYQAAPNRQSKFITLEGCPETAAFARHNFEQAGYNNIQLVTGNFNNTLPSVLKQFDTLDYVFFDGNHQKKPTLNYFFQCLKLINNETFFIFDDIHWSVEMEEAWETIKKNEKVTVTIDLFFIGLIFFRKELSKQNFEIRYIP